MQIFAGSRMIQPVVQSVKSALSTNPLIGTCYIARFGLDKRLVPPPANSDTPQVSETCRTRWVRAFRLLFGCAWAVFAFASPVSADVLVSNIGQTTTTATSASGTQYAAGFRTGSNAAGYTFESVEIEFNAVRTDMSGLTVRLLTRTSETPLVFADVATMTNPSSISVGANTFTAPSATTLTANTDYFIFIKGADDDLRRTTTNGEDSGAATGWHIWDAIYYRHGDAGSWNGSTTELKIRINGTVTGTNSPDSTPTQDTQDASARYRREHSRDGRRTGSFGCA